MRSDDTREGRNMKKTKWRQHLRGACKWSGVTLCVLLFALWLVSGWYSVNASLFGTSGRSSSFCGSCVIGTSENTRATENRFSLIASQGQFGPAPTWRWWDWGIRRGTSYFYLLFPLWLPFLLIALPTGWLFWSDHRRRKRVGCCEKCGYDLKGNTSGKCPECGATTPARAAT